MTLNDAKKMDRCEIVYMLILSKLFCYRMSIEKVTLHRKKNAKGRLVSDFVFYLADANDNIHIEKCRVYDEEYLWLSVSLGNDFPDVEFIDITKESEKPQCVTV